MPCYTPLPAYRTPAGVVSVHRRDGYTGPASSLQLRCGNCIGCRTDRSRAWALRIVHESMMHQANSFITLTYDNEHLPNDGGLDVRSWQLFAKRLRKALGPFRFYHCGEYGPNTNRPHYHAAIFGHDFAGDRLLLRRTKQTNLYSSPLLQQTWGLGYATVGDLTIESAAYIARYCMKKLNGQPAAEQYGDLRPPYATMSRGGRTGQGGIGQSWFKKYKTDVYPSDEITHKGRKFRPPKYYDNKLTKEELTALQNKRRQHVNRKDNTPERLRTRERVKNKQLALRQEALKTL